MSLANGDTRFTAVTPRQAKVYITSAYEDPDPIQAFREHAKNDRIKVHRVVSSPEEADIILFIENSRFHSDHYFSKLLNHPLVKRYPEKVFMYNPHDIPWTVLRGLYANIPKSQFDEKYLASAPYFEVVNQFIQCDFSEEPKYLYSFYGAPSSPVRKKIFHIKHHPRSLILHSDQHMYFHPGEKPMAPQVRYAELMRESKFVLAPKGIGTSSIRLFEILKSGRVPVIFSDQYVYPKGPDWSKIAVIVPEKDIENVAAILDKEEASWPERARAAKQAWDDYFAPDVVFHYFIESIRVLQGYDYHMSSSLKLRNIYPFYRYAFRKVVIERVSPVVKPILKSIAGMLVPQRENQIKEVR